MPFRLINISKFLLIAFVLSSCGFKPLYVERTTQDNWYFQSKFDGSINDEMAKVNIEMISGRFGQIIRNELLDILNPKGLTENKKYNLYVEIDKVDIVRQALRRDITATRERAKYRAVYYMKDSEKELFRSDSVAYVSYDIMSNPYSTTMAQKDAEENAAKIIAQDIALHVGSYFHLDIDDSGNK